MLGGKYIGALGALSFLLSASSAVLAEPFTVTYSDTISSGTSEFNVGETFTVAVVLDNGGTTAASQTWTLADVESITFSLNDAPNTITTVFSQAAINTGSGTFTTDATGALTAVPIYGGGSPGVISTNDPNVPLATFFLNGGNSVYFNNTGDASIANVSNNVNPAFWSSPAAALPPSITAVPTVGLWGIGILSAIIGLMGMYHRPRK